MNAKGCLAVVSIAIGTLGLKFPAVADTLHAAEVARELGYSDDEIRRLQAGEIISRGLKENTKKELAVSVAMHVPVPMERMREAIRGGEIFAVDRLIYAYGEIPLTDATPEAFTDAAFTPSEQKEVANLLKAKPGAAYNLGPEDVARFEALGHTRGAAKAAKDPQVVEAVSNAYRAVLWDRLTSYRAKGLSGIAPYARGRNKVSSAAEDLRAAAAAETGLSTYLPESYRAFLNYPADQPDNVEHQFYWMKEEANGRPAFVLSHRMWLQEGEHTIYANRQFYVGHSYNALQILTCLIGVEDGVVMIYVNRTATDQVAGMGSGLAHKIGRGMLQDSIKENFRILREAVTSS